jgi:hypothetical protein
LLYLTLIKIPERQKIVKQGSEPLSRKATDSLEANEEYDRKIIESLELK